jgi:hypothetical protein
MKASKVLLITLLLLTLTAGAAYWYIRPGVFTVQPISAIPEGGTVIYHSRGYDMPLFASADGLCLKLQGSVSLLCRMAAMGGAAPALTERVIVRLPYSRIAYLLSTNGQEFEK